MEYLAKLKALTNNLQKCEIVTRHTIVEENQSDTLANSLIGFQESLEEINTLIVELYSSELDEEKIEDIILDIGEELRHILYHINDTKVYDYLKE